MRPPLLALRPPSVASRLPALLVLPLVVGLGLRSAGAGDAAPPGRAASGESPPRVPRQYKRVLHAGDSMVGFRGGLSKALAARFAGEGAVLRPDAWNGVGIERFARDGRLARLVKEVQPDLVLITLGTNDVFVPHPQALAPWVRSIVKSVGPRDCYWLGPPTWKGDTGVVEVIRANAGPCVFFDASGMPLERIHDGIHLTDAGGATWAAAFWQFFRGADAAPAAGPSLVPPPRREGDATAGPTAPQNSPSR